MEKMIVFLCMCACTTLFVIQKLAFLIAKECDIELIKIQKNRNIKAI